MVWGLAGGAVPALTLRASLPLEVAEGSASETGALLKSAMITQIGYKGACDFCKVPKSLKVCTLIAFPKEV